ncbi:MAG: OmpH family outer membrane protein [Planctomycetes bacterium]|nr:OmpH family outer membrane protein [Planctomycetota bacterium]
MPSTRNRFNGLVFAFAVLVLSVIAYQTHAMRTMAMMQPTVIATLDLEKVFGQLQEVNVAEKVLENEIMVLVEANKIAEETIKALQADQEDFPPGGQKFEEIEDRLMRAAYAFKADVDYIKGYKDRRNAEIVRAIYLKISDAAKQVAEMRGVDIVLVDDSIIQVNPGTLVDVNRQIAARRMLYTNPNLDLTVDVVNLMNKN